MELREELKIKKTTIIQDREVFFIGKISQQ